VTHEDAPTVRTAPVLAVFAHPDDAEIAAGGVLSKWARAGREVHLLVLTNGDRGSQDPRRDRGELARTRRDETEAAAAVMGLASCRILSTHDGELRNRPDIREAVVRRIREVRAETLLSCDPTSVFFENRYYNHSDHRTAGWIALDSSSPGAGNPHFFTEHLGEGLDVQDLHDVWLGWTNEPNHVEEITATFQTKVDALEAHVSQITEGIAYWEKSLREEAERAGTRLGLPESDLAYGEEFRVLDLT
jgi:LmbE family N-acetylglucosaminyl deacetylase